MKTYTLYTDGACSGNPGPGGWGALILQEDEESEICGGEPETTNNRMELTAAIEALKQTPEDAEIRLYTDSKYVMDGITQWMANWKKNGWRTAAKKPVKNEDLWRELDALVSVRRIHWQWVKGHAGHPGNEQADALANKGMRLALAS